MRRVLSIIISISLILCSCILSNQEVYAEEKAFPDEKITREITVENEILEGEALDKYNKLLLSWSYDGIVSDTCAEFPAFYGGAYLNEKKELVIQVTSLSDEIKRYFSDIIDTNNVVFEVVETSYAELLKEHSRIEQILYKEKKNDLEKMIVGVGMSVMNNSVKLYLDCDENTLEKKWLTEKMQKLTDVNKVCLEVVKGGDDLISDLNPGSEINNYGGGSKYSRSVGFWAIDSYGNYGIVTSPHSNLHSGDSVYINGTLFGVALTPYPSGTVDAVFIKRQNASFSATRYVPGWAFYLSSNTTILLCEGSSVYTRGMATGCHYGSVTDINYTSESGVTGAVKTDIAVDHGDSGGIVAGGGNSNTKYAAGIMFARTKYTHLMIFCKAINVLSTLNISLY